MKRPHRNKWQVTYDRLMDQSAALAGVMDGAERDALGIVLQVLYEMGEEGGRS